MKEKILKHFQKIESNIIQSQFNIYYAIIAQVDTKSQYTERHHILPKSLFPEYKFEKWNIVRLSAKNHFLAHYHLFKMLPKNRKMTAALWSMCNQVSPNHRREFLDEHKAELADIYAEARQAHATNMSEMWSEGKYDHTVKRGKQNPLHGIKRTTEVVDKMKKNHWTHWRKPWEHNMANKKAWSLSLDAYDLWIIHNKCGYVRLDTLLSMPSQSFKTILEHFRKDWNPHTDRKFQSWLSSLDTNNLA